MLIWACYPMGGGYGWLLWVVAMGGCCLLDADLGLRSDVVTNSRLQAIMLDELERSLEGEFNYVEEVRSCLLLVLLSLGVPLSPPPPTPTPASPVPVASACSLSTPPHLSPTTQHPHTHRSVFRPFLSLHTRESMLSAGRDLVLC